VSLDDGDELPYLGLSPSGRVAHGLEPRLYSENPEVLLGEALLSPGAQLASSSMVRSVRIHTEGLRRMSESAAGAHEAW
jgi:hypothetical protein